MQYEELETGVQKLYETNGMKQKMWMFAVGS